MEGDVFPLKWKGNQKGKQRRGLHRRSLSVRSPENPPLDHPRRDDSHSTRRQALERAMEAPVKYAKSGNVHLAYRVFGDGPRDIVLIPGTLSHLELTWERPSFKHLLERLAEFARVVVFEKRGQGLSDRLVSAEYTLEERITDTGHRDVHRHRRIDSARCRNRRLALACVATGVVWGRAQGIGGFSWTRGEYRR